MCYPLLNDLFAFMSKASSMFPLLVYMCQDIYIIDLSAMVLFYTMMFKRSFNMHEYMPKNLMNVLLIILLPNSDFSP